MRSFTLWRWALLCCFALRHRAGESVMLCQKGVPPRKTSRCTRCGVKGKGLGH